MQASPGIAIDSQIIGAVLGALLVGLFGWNAWLTIQLIKIMVKTEVFFIRAGPVLDAIYADLPGISLKTNPKPYTPHQLDLIARFDSDPRLLTDEELEELRQAYDEKRKDTEEEAAYRTVAALNQGAVRGEIQARQYVNQRGKHWFWRLLWRFL